MRIPKIRPPFGGTWTAFRDETGKWMAWFGAVGGLLWGAWKWSAPLFGAAAPYILGFVPLILFILANYAARKSNNIRDSWLSFVVPAIVLAILVPSLTAVCFLLYEGNSIVLKVHLWTFFWTSLLPLLFSVIAIVIWILRFYNCVWRRLLFCESLLSEMLKKLPQEQRLEMLRLADRQCDKLGSTTEPSEIPSLTRGIVDTFQGC
ncbi:MAG TPA: hypothetical protein VFG04_03825 [Planctomycetaceae bacterium]|jgi:hypothetical protein|nr:hypothetical protein [Planctomycetaceae bacterium]